MDSVNIENAARSGNISSVNVALCKVLKSRKALGRRDLSPKTIARFHQKYRQSSGCWLWTAFRHPAGYGMVNLGRDHAGRQHTDYAHRVAFVLAHGDIPAGPYVVMHTCDERACVNPSHLRIGSQAENIHDGIARRRMPQLSGRRRPTRSGRVHSESVA